MQSKTKIKPLILIAVGIITLLIMSACGAEQGEIKKVKIESNASAVETIKSDFNKLDEEPGYKYKYMDVGRAHISIPYPASWTVSKNDDYDIVFTPPDDDPFFPGCQIYFHSSLELCVNTSDVHDVMDEYEGIINNYQYSYKGDQIRVTPSSSLDKSQVNTKISDPNNHDLISYRDFDADALNSSGRIPNDKIYHHVTAFYWKDYSCILSSLCSMDDNEYLNELILYMVSNSEYIEASLGTTRMYTLFDDKNSIKVPISDYYSGSEINGNNYINSGYNFICPSDSGTAFSHSFISIFEIEGKNVKITESNFEKKYLDIILKNNFGITSKSENIYGYLQDGGAISIDGQIVPEYIYKFDFAPGTKAANVQDGQPWQIIMYPVKNGDVTNLVILTTPDASIGSTYDTIKLIAKYGNF